MFRGETSFEEICSRFRHVEKSIVATRTVGD